MLLRRSLEGGDGDLRNSANVRRGTVVVRALIFATVGLMLQIGIMFLIGFRGGPMEYDWVISASLGLYIGATLASWCAAGWLLNPTISKSSAIFVGCIVAWISLFIEGLAGSSSQFLPRVSEHEAILNYIFKPMFWMVFVGTIPSLILGAIFGRNVWGKIHAKLP